MTKYTDPLQLYDRNLVIKSVIDVYESFVWTDVYCGCGDFEVKIPCEIAKKYNIDIGDLLMCSLSKKMMIIETVNIEYDSDNSVMVTYKGRSLESILYRRVLRKEDVPNIVPQYSSQNEKSLNIKNISGGIHARKRLLNCLNLWNLDGALNLKVMNKRANSCTLAL